MDKKHYTYQDIKDYGIAYGFIVGEQRLDLNCVRDLNHALNDYNMGIVDLGTLQEKYGFYIY